MYDSTMKSWLMSHGRTHTSVVTFVNALCEAMKERGLPLDRLNLLVRTIHPTYEFMVLTHSSRSTMDVPIDGTRKVQNRRTHTFGENQVEQFLVEYGHTDEPMFKTSPFQAIIDGESYIRCRLSSHDPAPKFPIFKDLIALGMTDYVAFPLDLSPPDFGMMSMTSACADGFSDEHLMLLQDITPMVSMVLAPLLLREAYQAVLGAYLGEGPASEVYSGRIQMGDVEEIEAVVGFVDMRSFTATTQRAEGTEIIQRLNRFFSALNEVVTEGGGNILKFMGDGALVVFPLTDRDPAAVAQDALLAHSHFRSRLSKLNEEHAADPLGPIEFGMALHIGTVLYGNIGAPNRLDFTVIGPAVNLTARLQGLCPRFGVDMVASEDFAALLPQSFTDIGTHRVRGVQEDVRVFQPQT
jgi:adenylate cyclase